MKSLPASHGPVYLNRRTHCRPAVGRSDANAELRTREHLTPGEIDTVIEAAKANGHGHRDATMILLAFRHGLRAAGVCDLRWDQVEFDAAPTRWSGVGNFADLAKPHPIVGSPPTDAAAATQIDAYTQIYSLTSAPKRLLGVA
jgi:integrase